MNIIDSFKGDYGFLSNFHLSPINIGDVLWPSVENYYQAMKTDNTEKQEEIRKVSPAQSKKLGRMLTLRYDWDNIKLGIMTTAVAAKFEQHPVLRQKLIQTGDAQIVEGNWWHDNIWGDCRCKKCSDVQGMNQLGNLLMNVRETYMEEPMVAPVYAGIGARNTPVEILELMHQWAQYSAQKGWVCSTGACKGADQAFANGALYRYGRVQLHIPWASYEQDWIRNIEGDVDLYVLSSAGHPEAFGSVRKYHPNYDALKDSVIKLHARNYNIIQKAKHIVCWTPGGAVVGGTGQALRIAQDMGITVYNLGDPHTRKAFEDKLRENGYRQ